MEVWTIDLIRKAMKMSDFETRYKTWHARLSYVKSAIRMASSALAVWFSTEPVFAIVLLSSGFLIAEIVGVLEELI
jgi:fumarate reductase subunit C